MTNDDLKLVAEYAASQSEIAFATLVERYTNFVYSAALRQVRDPHLAEEVTQAVFIILSRKAGSLNSKTILTGWLYRTTHYVSRSILKREARRQRLEQEAYMESFTQNLPANEHWEHLSPILDEAMLRLRAKERDAILLRYFENKNLREVGTAMGLEERAAQKRVARGLEKLRAFFAKCGVALSSAAIAGIVSANSVQAAPAGLALSTAITAKSAAVGGSTLTLIKGALKIMAWTKAKTAIVVGVGLLLATGTATVMVKKFHKPEIDDSFFTPDTRKLFAAPANLLILRPTHFHSGSDAMSASRSQPAGARYVGRNQSLEQVLEMAYATPKTRMVLPLSPNNSKFDYLITLPNNPMEALRSEIKRQTGLAGHPELRAMNVFLLKGKTSGRAGLRLHPNNTNSSLTSDGKRIHATGQSIDPLSGYIEYALNQPVLDQTGMSDRYDYDLDQRLFDGTGDSDDIKAFVLNQFGLELVPSREPVEMLVVKKN